MGLIKKIKNLFNKNKLKEETRIIETKGEIVSSSLMLVGKKANMYFAEILFTSVNCKFIPEYQGVKKFILKYRNPSESPMYPSREIKLEKTQEIKQFINLAKSRHYKVKKGTIISDIIS